MPTVVCAESPREVRLARIAAAVTMRLQVRGVHDGAVFWVDTEGTATVASIKQTIKNHDIYFTLSCIAVIIGFTMFRRCVCVCRLPRRNAFLYFFIFRFHVFWVQVYRYM